MTTQRVFTNSALLAVLFVASGAIAADPNVFGWVEIVQVRPGNLEMSAKLDTGAERSSAHAPDSQTFQRDGGTWVRFTLQGESGRTQAYERLVVDLATIRRAGTEKQRRQVVLLGVCLGDRFREIEVTLAGRSRMDHDLLLGRDFLAGNALVDSGKRFTVRPKCHIAAE